MRIRRETGTLNWRAFFKVFGIAALLYSSIVILDLVSGDGIRITSWVNLVLYPAIFGGLYAHSMRTVRLFVNDYRHVADFSAQLRNKFVKEGYQLTDAGGTTLATPIQGLRKFTQRWFGSEEITITWGEELTIAGTVRPVSWLEDVLTWNPAFRYAPATN